MLMRPVRPPSKALPTCALLNFPIHLPVSWESAALLLECTTVVQNIWRTSLLKATEMMTLKQIIKNESQKK